MDTLNTVQSCTTVQSSPGLRYQGCARLFFFGITRLWLILQYRWLNSDSNQIPNLLTWLNSDSTQNPNLLTWLNSDSTHLSQSWVKSDSRLITFYLIWEKVVDRGGGVRSNVAVGWFFLCKVTDNCKILTFSPRKIIDSTLTQAISSWLNSDSNDYQRDSTLTRLISLIFTADSTLTRLIWVRVESNLTHDSWVEHNPGGRPPLGEILAWKESLTLTCTYYEHETYTGSSFF